MTLAVTLAPEIAAAYEARVRSWAKVALPLVAVITIGITLSRDIAQVVVVPLVVLWALSAWWALGNPVGRMVELALVLVVSAAASPGGTLVATTLSLSLSLYYRASVSASLAFALSVASVVAMQSFPSASLPAMPFPSWVFVFPMMFFFAMGRLLRSGVLGQMRAQELADRLGETNVLLERSLERTAELAAANERTRIARDLHDSLGHRLTISHVHLQVAERENVDDDPQLAKPLAEARAAVTSALRELRQCVALLREPTAGLEVIDALRGLVEDIPRDSVHITFEVEGDERDLPPEVGLCFFRGLQEALTNVARHAGADNVEVRLNFGEHDVRLEVRDDGVGARDTGGGHGLVGLAERATAVGATLEIDTRPGEGLGLTLSWRAVA